ncbi:MAG: insulinase family protein [Verrucomicrobiota bacterium]
MKNKLSLVLKSSLLLVLSLALLGGCREAGEKNALPQTQEKEEAKTTQHEKGETGAIKASVAEPIPLAQESSDVKADPAVKWGVLENGMRYAIMKNAEPPKRVSMRLFVDAGSLMEHDNQQGLAHFLEHMAFNGSKHFPAGEMVEYFQRLGMAFGADTNAHTGFKETVYKLEMPDSSPELLSQGFQLMRDYADGMLLGGPEIDKERGVIMSEKRTRDSVGWRTFVAQLQFILPEGLISQRLPIGKAEVISNAPRERFVEFYKKWYTPDRMAFIVVGEVDEAEIEAQIKKYFTDLKPAEKKMAEPDLGKLASRELAVHFHPESEAGEVSVSIDTMKPAKDTEDTLEHRARDLRLMLANRIISRRLGILAKKEGSAILSGTSHSYDLYDLGFVRYASIGVECRPENWQKALQTADQELRRALQFGFTAAELKESKANVKEKFSQAAKSMGTRKSRVLSSAIASRIGSREVFTNPADDLVWAKAELEKITADECQALLKKAWTDNQETLVMVTGNLELENADTVILDAYKESQSVEVEAPVVIEDKAFAYGELPEPGKVAKKTVIEDLEVTQLILENGVRVNLKVTDFEDQTIHVKARFGGGRLVEPKDQPGLAFFAGSTFSDGGLGAHDIDQIRRLYAGITASARFGVEDDSFAMSGKTNSDDLHQQLLLLRAYFTDPGFRPEAAVLFRRGLDQIYQQIKRTPQGVMQSKVSQFLHGGDSRFGFPAKEEMEKLSEHDVQQWLQKPLASAYLELTVVGDFEMGKMIDEVLATFGNLPKRDKEKPDYAKQRKVSFPEADDVQIFKVETAIPKAMPLVYWPTEDIWDIKRTRRLSVLSLVLDDRLRKKVREELGDAYSPFAHNLPSDAFKGYGYLFASVTAKPDQAAMLIDVVKEIGKGLSEGTVDQDELERAKKPQINQIEEYRRTNRYWMNSVLQSSQEYPQRLDWARSFISDYQAIGLDEINELAKKYLTEDKALSVLIEPSGEAQAEEKK